MAASVSPKPGDRVEKWGYSFTWTEDHFPRELTDPLQHESDELADAALEKILAIQAGIAEKLKAEGITPPRADMFTTLRDHRGEDEALQQLWDEAHTVPDWVDWDQIERGQKYFSRYALANMVGFALQGFVAENSASLRVTEVLVRTGGFSTRKLLQRLIETFQWLVHVTDSLESLQPGGSAHIATIRIRLLHASVRHRVRSLAAKYPNYYDLKRLGVPVNTLDSIHSISVFSGNQIWMQLPRMGIYPSQQEQEDYVALMRYIGYVVGTPHEWFDDLGKAKKLMESLYVHELEVTETSHVVAHNFMECVSNLPFPFYISRSFLEAGSRWINGDDLCDQLDLGNPSYFSYLIFMGQCLLSVELAWAQRMFPSFDEFVVKHFRKMMYQGLVERKSRTGFDFKWVPDVGKRTGKEDYVPDLSKTPTVAERIQNLAHMGPIEGVFLGIVVSHFALLYVTARFVLGYIW